MINILDLDDKHLSIDIIFSIAFDNVSHREILKFYAQKRRLRAKKSKKMLEKIMSVS